jgi:hypothetical protein
MSVTTTPPTIAFDFRIELIAPDVQSILLNGSTTGVSVAIPHDSANFKVADVTVVTYSGNPYTKALQLGGADGVKFTLSNGGVAPCALNIGATSVPGGTYSVKIAAP